MITNSQEFNNALIQLVNGDRMQLHPISKYLWANYYRNLHIASGSEEDKENDRIYLQFEQDYPDLYHEIEVQVDIEINNVNFQD